MDKIDKYCEDLKKSYKNTDAVLEQIEEIRDILTLKTEENIEKGFDFERSVELAIDSLGDVEVLFTELTVTKKLVYWNRLTLVATLITTAIVALVMFLVGALLPLENTFMWGIFGNLCAFLSIFVAQLGNFIHPNKKKLVRLDYKDEKHNITHSLIGYSIISVVMVILNAFFPSYEYIWFVFPMVGVLYWPIVVLIEYAFLKGNKFEVKET